MASAANSAVLEADDRVLIIERVFDAPRELVWDAFTNTEHLMQWMGPRDHPAVSYEADARPGGKWRGCLRSPDDVTFATLVTITFEDEGDRTRMRFQQNYFNTKANRDGHNFGWNSGFDRLAEFLATEKA